MRPFLLPLKFAISGLLMVVVFHVLLSLGMVLGIAHLAMTS